MEQFRLSKRLKEVAAFLPRGAWFADIGSDHAYLPCFICSGDSTSKAIAGEVNRGPFESAQKNVRKLGLEHQIEVRLGDGLEVIHLSDQIKQLVIAGMGGGLITKILVEGKDKLVSVER